MSSSEFATDVFTSIPSIPIDVKLYLDSGGVRGLLEQSRTPDAAKASTFTASVPTEDVVSPGSFGLRLATASGEELYSASIDYSR